ncbi:LCP family protein [Nocardioides sp. Bht2]|uniref:LCP family protein n=1 Tax=Nocardioides sp. Bht2 TaxID=3392297 RepID=UPI0039B5FE4B
MVDRPQGPEPGTPEYDWLYGKQRPEGDDATRVMPVSGQATPEPPPPTRKRPIQQHPYQQPPPPARPVPAQTRPVQPPPGGPGGSGPRSRRFPIRPVRLILLLLALWLVFLAVVPFVALRKVSTVDAFPDGKRPADQDGTTYLIVGSDSREGLTKKQRKELGTGNAGGQRTDTIMLLHTGSGPNLLMSIPRDSRVEIPGRGVSKINSAFAWGGPKLLIKTVEQNTGIKIDNYVEIGFGGFVDVVDAVGGIEICPTRRMKDKDANLDIKKGCQQADGVVALGFARSRKTDPQLGDITRAKHQREVVSAVGKKVLSPWTFVNPFRYWNVNMAAAQTLKVSDGTGPIDLARFGYAMTRVNGDNGLTCGVPIRDLAVTWDPQRSKEFFQHVIDDDTDGISKELCTASGLPK